MAADNNLFTGTIDFCSLRMICASRTLR